MAVAELQRPATMVVRVTGRWLGIVEDSEAKLLVQVIEIWWGDLRGIERRAELLRMPTMAALAGGVASMVRGSTR